MTETVVRTPEEIVKDLAPAYEQWKSGEKDKDKYRKEFFAAITEALDNDDRAEIVVTVPGEKWEDAHALVEKEYPTWLVRDSRPIRGENPEENAWEFILWENPAYQSYTIEYEGKVWSRQVVAGSTYVDDELILDRDLDLWLEVTEYPNEEKLAALVKWVEPEFDKEQIHDGVESFCDSRGIDRVMKPLEDLTPDQLAKVKDYVYEGKPTIKLPAPKNAKK